MWISAGLSAKFAIGGRTEVNRRLYTCTCILLLAINITGQKVHAKDGVMPKEELVGYLPILLFGMKTMKALGSVHNFVRFSDSDLGGWVV